MSKGNKFSSIVNYFKKLAGQHSLLQHTEQNKKFFRLEPDEFVTGLRKAEFPALVMESYQFSLSDQSSDNPKKDRLIAFDLVSKVSDAGNYDEIHKQWDILEEIGDDIIIRIKADKRKSDSPVAHFDLNSIDAQLLTLDEINVVGIRYTCIINSNFPTDIDPSRWLSNE